MKRVVSMAIAGFILLLTLGFFINDVRRQQVVLANDAYVWQRKWTPALIEAIQSSNTFVHTWRVLAAEQDNRTKWSIVSPDWSVLTNTQRPVTAVVRIDGQLGELDDTGVERVVHLAHDWQARHINLVALEIDHDCASARLEQYAQTLRTIRQRLAPQIRLSITALPTWLESNALDQLLDVADESVLQVHAVLDPVHGLFNSDKAEQWVRDYSRRTKHPWRVALPTYGMRVAWDQQGRIAGVESERPLLLASGSGQLASQELVASPRQISDFAQHLDSHPPAGLSAIAWFRLPTHADERVWGFTTWQAILKRQTIHDAILIDARATEQTGMYEVSVVSMGNTDAALPSAVRFDSQCEAADGINGYALEYDTQGMLLRRRQPAMLRAGNSRRIGWLRCTHADKKEISVYATK